MTKLFVHAKLLIDGINDTPKFDQLISIEDDKIKAIKIIMKYRKMSLK